MNSQTMEQASQKPALETVKHQILLQITATTSSVISWIILATIYSQYRLLSTICISFSLFNILVKLRKNKQNLTKQHDTTVEEFLKKQKHYRAYAIGISGLQLTTVAFLIPVTIITITTNTLSGVLLGVSVAILTITKILTIKNTFKKVSYLNITITQKTCDAQRLS